MIQNRRTSPSRRCVPRLPLCKINFCRWHHGPLAMPRFLLFERRARTLARWIVPTRPDHINVREMTRGAKPLPGLCDPAHRTTSIDWLRKCGWFLPKQAKAPSRKGGHPRAGHTINPNLWLRLLPNLRQNCQPRSRSSPEHRGRSVPVFRSTTSHERPRAGQKFSIRSSKLYAQSSIGEHANQANV